MLYELWEYSWLTSRGKCIGRADFVAGLPWEDFDHLNTYAIKCGRDYLAEFEGYDALTVRTWFMFNSDYQGERGCKAWEG